MGEIEDFDNEVINAKTPVLVDFWAEWCGPCRSLLPILEETEKALNGTVDFVKVNVDENSDLAQKYGIRGIPTLLLFKDGKVQKTFVGVQIKDDLLDSLRELIDK